MPQPDYPRTEATVESAKRSAAIERQLSIPIIGWDVDEDGIVQHEGRKQEKRRAS